MIVYKKPKSIDNIPKGLVIFLQEVIVLGKIFKKYDKTYYFNKNIWGYSL